MPRSRTVVRPELISLIRAMRRHAGRMRRQASHDKRAERLRAFADYLDAQAGALEATPVQSRPSRLRHRVGEAPGSPHVQRLLPAVLAMLS
jgi:hypothetical protein